MLPPCDFERVENEFKLSRPMWPGIRHGELSANRARVISSFYEEFSTPILTMTKGQAFGQSHFVKIIPAQVDLPHEEVTLAGPSGGNSSGNQCFTT
jgi:hypothetical protein